VGDAHFALLPEATAKYRFPWLNAALWRSGRLLHPEVFDESGALPVTDDHTALQEAGIPATLLIDFDYPHWHHVSDTLDKCSPRSLGVTGRVLLHALVDQPPPKAP